VSGAPNICAGPFGRLYDFYIERPRLMQAIGRAVWGIDAALLYRCFDAIGETGAGATVLDVPCGGGVAFRAVRPDQDLRYIAGDIDDRMLARARRRAGELGLPQVEVITVDMTSVPLPDDSVDLFASFSGLHMLPEPEEAVREIARCLKPGGRVVGTTFLRDGALRQRLLFAAGALRGHPQPPRPDDLAAAFDRCGIEQFEISPLRGFAAFHGRKRPDPSPTPPPAA
jgi:ubiquinone/menaquinone biosynthesis C-methylase UbiE